MRVLVTSATSGTGLAVLRDLARAGYQVVGAAERPPPLGLHSRFLDHLWRYDDPDAVPGLVERTGADMVFAQESKMVRALLRIPQITLAGAPPAAAFETAYDNARTQAECAALRIPVPRSLDEAEARRALRKGETVVVKPRDDRGGARGVSYCRDAASLERGLRSCRASLGGALLQEYIPGEMRTAVLLFDRKSRLVAWFTMRKLRQYPLEGGITVMAESTRDPELVAAARPFFEKWRWQGLAEVEWKIDPRGHRPKLIEINPRAPGYMRFPIACGVHFPRLAVEAAAGKTEWKEAPSYRVGRRYVAPMSHLRGALNAWRHGVRLGALLSEMCAYPRAFDPTDVLPEAAIMLRGVRR